MAKVVKQVGAGLLMLLASCSATRDWNPFVNLSEYDTVVVEDFQYQGAEDIGRTLADQLASELVRIGAFEQVLRARDGSEAIVVGGPIHNYREGSVAARIKYGTGVGEAKLELTVVVSADPGLEPVGSFRVAESTMMTGPDASRTGREDADWLRRRTVERIAQVLQDERRKGLGN